MENAENQSPRLSNAKLIGQVQPEHFADIPFVSPDILPEFIKQGIKVVEYSYPYFLGMVNPVTVTNRHIIFEAIDDTMKPAIRQGDKVLGYILTNDDLDSMKEGMYIFIVNDQLVMRRIRENTLKSNGTLLLYTDDAEAAPIVATLENTTAIWQAQGSMSSVN
ncbi:hypothetical protein [Larkinella rosea]|uniref:Peptidase S24/S26A/S26B/S26C domain-containing protein n=1 Tax=Larkinella rosea TaxID=2025312 RepID=A0A3P1C3J4_9BACT|nr:hypothetical protein [Larkinella rosea]RRB07868.1 hypothetical protein EHT25_08855 [Larkinella rosea]